MNLSSHFIPYIISVMLAGFILSCNENSNKQKPSQEISNYKRPLMEVNKTLVKKDMEIIEAYVKRRKWDMQITETGLWYMIYEHGTGDSVKSGEKVSISYKLYLLDGKLCYNSDSLGIKTFVIEKSDVERGLVEGVKLMRKGDKARLILPPHLAHGIPGDGNCIPNRAIIHYDIELLYN